MYVSPNHPNRDELLRPQAPRQAPEPSGQELLVLERPGRGRGPDTELRCVLDSYMGSQYIGLRVWSKGAGGNWYPTPKGCSVKLREAEDLAAALTEAVRLARAAEAKSGQGGRGGRTTQRPTQRHRSSDVTRSPAANGRQQSLPTARPADDAGGWDQNFSEFAD